MSERQIGKPPFSLFLFDYVVECIDTLTGKMLVAAIRMY